MKKESYAEKILSRNPGVGIKKTVLKEEKKDWKYAITKRDAFPQKKKKRKKRAPASVSTRGANLIGERKSQRKNVCKKKKGKRRTG